MRALAAALLMSFAVAARADDPRAAFTHTADVFAAPPGGLLRIELPAAVLAECRPDLSDLRLLDADGREIPYLIDAGRTAATAAPERERVDAELLDVRREEVRRATGPPLYREVYRLRAPPRAPDGGTWELVLRSARNQFVRQLHVEERWGGERHVLVEDASVFRLDSPAREKTRIALSGLEGSGEVVVTLVGEDDAYLVPSFAFEQVRDAVPPTRLTVPLVEVARTRSGDRTVVELARPAGLVPDLLRLETTTGAFDRMVEVWDLGPAGRRVLIGRGVVRRLEPGTPHEKRQVELSPARGERLAVEIVDRDSPPLEGLVVSGEIRQPALFFSLPVASDATPAVGLYFGGGRVPAPRYDLAGLASLLATDADRPIGGTRTRDLSHIDVADLRDPRPNPAASASPTLDYAMRPAAEIDRRLWSHRRPFAVPASPGGLTRLRLAPEDLARARPDLADVRVVDASGRQWPYLIEMDAGDAWLDLAVAAPERDDRRSRYRLGLPVRPLRVDRLDLETSAPYFDRNFELRATRGRDETVARGRLVRRAGRDTPLTIALPPARVEALTLVVGDGDDAPLVFESARAHVPLPELYLAAPPGDYALLVGNPDARAPVYELARLREAMLAVAAVPAVAGATGTPNPDYSTRAAGQAGLRRLGPQVALWAVLIGAVLALTVVTLRLARREEPDRHEPS